MDEVRFGRLEDKVDRVKDELSEVKHDVHEIHTKMDVHIDKVDEHITGDRKIINQIEPLLAELPSIVEIIKAHEVDKEIRKRKMDKVKTYGSKLGLLSVTVGIIATIYKTFF